jgi:hypothetical protein
MFGFPVLAAMANMRVLVRWSATIRSMDAGHHGHMCPFCFWLDQETIGRARHTSERRQRSGQSLTSLAPPLTTPHTAASSTAHGAAPRLLRRQFVSSLPTKPDVRACPPCPPILLLLAMPAYLSFFCLLPISLQSRDGGSELFFEW